MNDRPPQPVKLADIVCPTCSQALRAMVRLGLLAEDDVPVGFLDVHSRALGKRNRFWTGLSAGLRNDFFAARRGQLPALIAARAARARRGRALRRAVCAAVAAHEREKGAST